jgi:polyisoprenyl-phosphate glycosyltransferase
MFISIVIPVYYNEGSLIKTFEKVKQILDKNNHINSYEIIFIDDGSKDNSLKKLKSIKDTNSNVKIIKLTRNFGQVYAIYAGYQIAQGDVVVTLSADLQDPPELISQMIDEHVNNEYEIVVCTRENREENYIRRITSKIFYILMKNLSFPNMPAGGFDFALLSKKVIDYMNNSIEVNPFWQGQILWSGYSIQFIPYTRRKREIGKSRWTFGKKLKYLIDGVLGYSYLPIRLISLIGILIFLIGIFYSIVITFNYFFGDTPFKGWAPIVILILLLSGFQLLTLGFIGEYLWRTLDQVRNRPKYIVEKIWE